MNSIGREIGRISGLIGNWPGRAMSAFPAILKITGIVLLITGLQAWGFHRYIRPEIDAANKNLTLLQQGAPTNKLMNEALAALRDYWQVATDEVRKRQIVALREAVVRGFKENRRVSIDKFVRVARGFEPQSDVEQEALDKLQRKLSRLQAVYADHYGAVISRYLNVPWYLQPGATLLEAGRSTEQVLFFNHALYLMLVGDRSNANKMYTDLRRNAHSEKFKSRVLFAQARLHYEAYHVDPNVQYYDDALRYVQQSLRSDPEYGLPKLFLEFLLSFDQKAFEVDVTPVKGQGSGEGQGERGAISTGSRVF